jgi:hypothetical protein
MTPPSPASALLHSSPDLASLDAVTLVQSMLLVLICGCSSIAGKDNCLLLSTEHRLKIDTGKAWFYPKDYFIGV